MPSTGEQHSVLSPGSYVEACPSRVSCLVGGNVEVCSLDGQPTPRTSSPPQTLRCCKISQLTFILLCLMPSTICSICLKNWSRAAGEAMALKERSPEVCLQHGTVRRGWGHPGVSPEPRLFPNNSTRTLQGSVVQRATKNTGSQGDLIKPLI